MFRWTDTKNYCEDVDECKTTSGRGLCGWELQSSNLNMVDTSHFN